MKKEDLKTRMAFQVKSKELKNAAVQLKQEFFGMDHIVDQLIENVRSWYTLNDLQEKPSILNLWGLTGVGKTALVLRLMELIGLKNSTYRFDLGEKQGDKTFNSGMDTMCDYYSSEPLVLIFDEFQHARTLTGADREEKESEFNRRLWDLLDSGKLTYVKWDPSSHQLFVLVQRVKRLLGAGVIVENGLVKQKHSLWAREMREELDENEPCRLIPCAQFQFILEFIPPEMGIGIAEELESFLETKDGHETLQFLTKVEQSSRKPVERDFSKCLIINIGNIDEAFKMSDDYNSDLSADLFHEKSLKITIPDIKEALQTRFRSEQIARLGNVHIIYPSMNEKTYRTIIRKELDKLNQQMFSKYGLTYDFDSSVSEKIYTEGVYPTQGTRPVFTTIDQIIKSNFSRQIGEIYNRDIDIDTIRLSIVDQYLVARFCRENVVCFTTENRVESSLEKLRAPKQDEKQALVAVHESGHAVVMLDLLGLVPDEILSNTSSSTIAGMVSTNKNFEFMVKSEILPHVATFLAGMVAEELVFGVDYVTNGAESDIQRATTLLMHYYKRYGMHTVPGYFSKMGLDVDNSLNDVSAIEEYVQEDLRKAKTMARETLLRENRLFLGLAKHLLQAPKMDKSTLLEFVDQYGYKLNDLSQEKNHYREKLREKIQTEFSHMEPTEKFTFSLNSQAQ